MRIKDILVLESTNRDRIVLLKEGVFWRAYQVSAYLFVHYIRELKVTHKYVKTAKADAFFIGFPTKILEDVLDKARAKNWKIEREEGKIQITTDQQAPEEQFEEWTKVHRSIPEAKSKTDAGHPEIIERIRRFPIMEKTPLETQQFVLELKRMINGLV